jgi:hypothetical protein
LHEFNIVNSCKMWGLSPRFAGTPYRKFLHFAQAIPRGGREDGNAGAEEFHQTPDFSGGGNAQSVGNIDNARAGFQGRAAVFQKKIPVGPERILGACFHPLRPPRHITVVRSPPEKPASSRAAVLQNSKSILPERGKPVSIRSTPASAKAKARASLSFLLKQNPAA